MNRLHGAILLGLLIALPGQTQPGGKLMVGKEISVVVGPMVAHPQAASGNGAYLVVWQDGWGGVDATANIRGIRLGSTLKPLDKHPISICSAPEAQEAPVVAYGHDSFLVVWQDFRNGKNLTIRGVLIDAMTGKVRSKEIEIAGGLVNQCRPTVACAGKTFFVVWQEVQNGNVYGIRGVRIAATGKVLDESAIDYAAGGTSPCITAAKSRVLVAWAQRNRNRATTWAALIDPATGQKSEDLGRINTCCGDAPAAPHEDENNFITVAARAGSPDPWGWGGPGAIVLSRVLASGATPESKLDYANRLSNLCSRSVPNVVDAATWKGAKTWNAGAPGGFPGTGDGLWPTGWPSVAHVNGLYLFAWVKGTLGKDRLTVSNTEIWLRGMDARTLKVVVPDQRTASRPAADDTHPVLVTGPSGDILLLHERLTTGKDRQIIARRLRMGN